MRAELIKRSSDTQLFALTINGGEDSVVLPDDFMWAMLSLACVVVSIVLPR